MFGADLQRRYGEKIHQISLHGGFNCFNRDVSLGRGGCTFCKVVSFFDEQQQLFAIQKQIAQKVKKSILLKALYQQALYQANIVGLCVGTQPILDL